MLTTTIPSYLYKQYQDDDDLLAFVAAYNAATQTYVDWFNSVGLPFYPELSGDLLDWVANGLYGQPRTSLVQSATGASGMLNTAELNTNELNAFTAPATTYYDITDDIFKRILTWNFYKGDGKRFCLKWLKRRIMRFIVGTNGLNPNPLDPSFMIGPENTQAISATVSSDVLTVTINGAALSGLVQVQAGILNIFQSAFLSGVLDLPVQYTYACNIVTTITASAAPTSESVTGIATTLSAGTASVSALGGDGSYTYAWTWSSGGTGITINAASSADTSFTATGMTRGTTLTGTAKCTVTDSASHTAYAYVTVTITNVSVPSLSVSPASLSNTGVNSTEITANTTATVSGGAGPYTYAWTWQSGGSGITIDSPSSNVTGFQATSLASGETRTGTALCTVTDSYGQQATGTCSVLLSRVTTVSASCSPTSETASASTQPITTGSTTATGSGGSGTYTYSWSWQSGGADISINSPSAATTSFTGSGMSPGATATGVAQCVVTDAYGQTATTTCSVSITYLPPVLYTFTAAGTSTVPSGYSTAVVEGWGPGGGGGGGDGTLGDEGAGGGAGGYFRSQFSVTGGQVFTINSIGSGGAGGGTGANGSAGTGATQVTSPSSSVMTANPGGGGGTYPGTGGSGGTASGGNQTNATGGSGGSNGAYGVAANGLYSNNPATYGDGGYGGPKNAGGAGTNGYVSIRYS